jgi:hypothetical protein
MNFPHCHVGRPYELLVLHCQGSNVNNLGVIRFAVIVQVADIDIIVIISQILLIVGSDLFWQVSMTKS